MNSPATASWPCRMKEHCQRCFEEQHAILWPNLSRAVTLLAILNTSMFFVSGAVQFRGYFWPIYSLGILAAVEAVLLLPLGLNRQLWFYLSVLLLWMLAGWFFAGSLLFWLWIYLWHRLNHVTPFLWRSHRLHHPDRKMNVTTANRFHLDEIALSSVLRVPVLALLDARIEELDVYETLLNRSGCSGSMPRESDIRTLFALGLERMNLLRQSGWIAWTVIAHDQQHGGIFGVLQSDAGSYGFGSISYPETAGEIAFAGAADDVTGCA